MRGDVGAAGPARTWYQFAPPPYPLVEGAVQAGQWPATAKDTVGCARQAACAGGGSSTAEGTARRWRVGVAWQAAKFRLFLAGLG